MALELISQILSPTNATYVNGVSAERRFSLAILKNSWQKLVEKDGKGVTDKFVTEDDATHSAQVFVNRIIPVRMQPRVMGASKNGASYSANQHYTQTETVGIELLTVIDDPILIPRARRDMIPVDLVAEQTEMFSNRLATIINGATAGSKLLESYKADAGNHVTISSSDVTNKLVLQRLIEANTLLDEGDQDHGIDIFPTETRIDVFKVTYRPTLLGAGILNLGGANYAYEIAKQGGVSKDAEQRKLEDGYIGEIDGNPVHLISNESLQHASGFMGFPDNELKASPFVGYIASSYANARGVSTTERVKVVDEINGQGVRLLPYVKMGVATWYPKGVVTIANADYNPIDELKTLFSGVTGIEYKLKAAGSRLWPTGATFASVSASGFTVNGLAAADDWNTDHLKGAVYYVGTAKATSVHDFAVKYAAATEKGSVTVGSAVSATVADGQFINVLAIADDGSVALFAHEADI